MNRPTNEIVEAVAPSRVIDDLPISDGYRIRNVAHAEQLDTLRLSDHGAHDSVLVGVKKFYDGSSGGVAGHYMMIFVEFRAMGSRWRTDGVKVRAEEAARIARDMLAGKPSKPARNEPKRVGGMVIATDESELRGAPAPAGGYVIYIRNRMRSGEWGRTRGVEVLAIEKPIVVRQLKKLAEVE